MKTLSINNIVKGLKEQNKIYLTNYRDDGYELGFGRCGIYKGHSHYFYYDILFSPDKLIIKNKELPINGFLAVVPPRTFMNDIEIGNFFFIKFCPSNDIFSLPEKTDIVMNDREIAVYFSDTQLNFMWYKNPLERLNINLDVKSNSLIIAFDNQEKIKIIR